MHVGQKTERPHSASGLCVQDSSMRFMSSDTNLIRHIYLFARFHPSNNHFTREVMGSSLHTFFTTVTSRDSLETKHVHRIRTHLPQSTLTATTGHEHCISLDADETHSFSSHGWIFARRVDPITDNYYHVQANCHFPFSMQSIVLVVPDATERRCLVKSIMKQHEN